jgi:RNA polymerase sigma factor (sigma-70 family)
MGEGEGPSDEALMSAYVRGDAAAFSALFARYAPRLRRLVGRDLARASDADDLVQQTFLQMHRARRDFREGSRLRPWLYTIALNLKRQFFRSRARKPEAPLPEDGAGEPVAPPMGDPEGAVRDAQIRRALDALPEAQREVIVLHWFEGLSFREIAEVVGASQPAVKVRAHRGYEKLRQTLGTDDVTAEGERAYAGKGDGRGLR